MGVEDPPADPGLPSPEERAAEYAKLLASKERLLELATKEREELERLATLTTDQKTLLQINLTLRQSAAKVARLQVQTSIEDLNNLEKREAAGEKLTKLESKRLKRLNESLASMVKQAETLERQEKASDNLRSATHQLVQATTGVSDAWEKTILGGIINAEDGVGDITEQLLVQLTPMNILMSSWMKIAEITMKVAVQYDSMAADMNKIAGAASGLKQTTNEIYQANIQFGVSMEEAGAASEALWRNMAQFSFESKENQKMLGKQVALLQEVGVGAQTSAKMFNLFNKGLKMSNREMIATTTRLYNLSEALRVPPDVIFEDFAAAAPELAKYGKDMEGAFADLAVQAKNTGLSMQELLSVAKQFDTFEDAGNAVGRLNALLGGPYLNSIQMLNMEEGERIQTLRDSIQAAGLSWESMSRFERQAYATAAGISDMSVAAQMFGGTNQEFADAAENQEALEARAKEAQAAQQKLAQAAEQLAISMAPVVDAFSTFMGWVTSFLGLADGWVGKIVGIAIAFTAIRKAIAAVTAAKKMYVAMQKLVTLWTGKETAATMSLNQALMRTAVFVGAAVIAFVIFKKVGESLASLGPIVKTITVLIAALAIAVAVWQASMTFGSASIPILAAWGALAGAGAGLMAGVLTADAPAAYAEGTEDAAPGVAVVGEEGPELVNMGGGESVVSNDNFSALAGKVGELIDRFDKFLEMEREAKAKPQQKQKKLVLQVDQKALGEVVVDYINHDSELVVWHK
jgi:multisubunit Na+/H+ antiporter MnhC subunit